MVGIKRWRGAKRVPASATSLPAPSIPRALGLVSPDWGQQLLPGHKLQFSSPLPKNICGIQWIQIKAVVLIFSLHLDLMGFFNIQNQRHFATSRYFYTFLKKIKISRAYPSTLPTFFFLIIISNYFYFILSQAKPPGKGRAYKQMPLTECLGGLRIIRWWWTLNLWFGGCVCKRGGGGGEEAGVEAGGSLMGPLWWITGLPSTGTLRTSNRLQSLWSSSLLISLSFSLSLSVFFPPCIYESFMSFF